MIGAPRASRVRCGVPQAAVSAVAPPQVLTHTAATDKESTAATVTATLNSTASRIARCRGRLRHRGATRGYCDARLSTLIRSPLLPDKTPNCCGKEFPWPWGDKPYESTRRNEGYRARAQKGGGSSSRARCAGSRSLLRRMRATLCWRSTAMRWALLGAGAPAGGHHQPALGRVRTVGVSDFQLAGRQRQCGEEQGPAGWWCKPFRLATSTLRCLRLSL